MLAEYVRGGINVLLLKAQSPLHVTGKFREVGDMDHVMGMFRGFQTIATCRDGLKNSRDKSATSPFVSGRRGNRRRPRQVTGKSATSRTDQRGRHGFVTDLSRTSRGNRHNGIWAYMAGGRAHCLGPAMV